MKTVLRVIVAVLLVSTLSGCARFAFYKNETLSGDETGIKFYTAKPYLLVANTGAKDKPTEVSVIFIPDLANPTYAKPKPGFFGSSNLTMSLSNGMLTAMGQQTDTKLPETLAALGGLGESVATAKKTFRETSLLRPQAGVDYSQISQNLDTIASDLAKYLAQAVTTKVLTSLELQAGNAIVNTLKTTAQLLSEPTTAGQNVQAAALNLKNVVDNWDKSISKPSASTVGPELVMRRNIDVLNSQTKAILSSLTPKAPDQPTFTLYEINNVNGVTTLREVKF